MNEIIQKDESKVKVIDFSYLFIKRKYKVAIVNFQSNKPTILKIYKIKPDVNFVHYKNKQIPIDINVPTLTKNNIDYYYVDLNRGQISFKNSQNPNINYGIIDDVLSKEVIRQIVATLRITDFKVKIINYIIGAVMGLFAGLFIGAYWL